MTSIKEMTVEASLEGLPTELIEEVFMHLDWNSIARLSRTCPRFLQVYRKRKSAIVLSMLQRDFSPLDELLQVYLASSDDIVLGQTQYKPRRIIWKRYHGDNGIVLAPGPLGSRQNTVFKSRVAATNVHLEAETVILDEDDIPGILMYCLTVHDWERVFPQLRWTHDIESCRMLQPHEAHRMRRALYRWWLYSIHFHGDAPRPAGYHPKEFSADVRASQLRYHSSSELVELLDFMETVKEMVLQYIYPRLDPRPDDEIDEEDVSSVARPVCKASIDSYQSQWNQMLWNITEKASFKRTTILDNPCRVMRTYMKLDPKDLMHFFDNICIYPRKRLISEAHARLPNLTDDTESFLAAIKTAFYERVQRPGGPSFPSHTCGGIIDFGDERDNERVVYGSDGSHDGSLPVGKTFVRHDGLYQVAPGGDDGTFLGQQMCRDDYY